MLPSRGQYHYHKERTRSQTSARNSNASYALEDKQPNKLGVKMEPSLC